MESRANAQAVRALGTMSTDDFFRLLEEASPEQLHALSEVRTDSNVNVHGRLLSPSPSVAAPFSALLKSEQHAGLGSIAKWWESRRPLYNLLVALAGLPALFLVAAYSHASTVAVLTAVMTWALAANTCYTLGAPTELMAWMIWKQRSSHVGPLLYTVGTLFSAGLTFGAGLIVLMSLLIRV